MPSHHLNQCWDIVNWTHRNKLQWNFNQNTKFFIHENASEKIVHEMAAILSRRRWDLWPYSEGLAWSVNTAWIAKNINIFHWSSVILIAMLKLWFTQTIWFIQIMFIDAFFFVCFLSSIFDKQAFVTPVICSIAWGQNWQTIADPFSISFYWIKSLIFLYPNYKWFISQESNLK